MKHSKAQALVSEAREWINTPFQHQGRLKGKGVDCVGFIAEVAKASGVMNADIPADYKPREDGEIMLRLLREYLKPVKSIKAGDVLALCDEAIRYPDIPRHLVIVTEVLPHTVKVIHASQHGVREHRIDDAWRRRIHSIWRIKHD